MISRVLITVIIALSATAMHAIGMPKINIDKKTAAAMTAAYVSESEMESNNGRNLEQMLKHYKSAAIATAGIYESKKRDWQALRSTGIFSTEENFYYRRIRNLVQSCIMPRFISVASKLIKQPENVMYWGPWLLKTTDEVEMLCKEFQLVVTNGKLRFDDVTFLLINDDLRKIFDLAQLGNEDWKGLINRIGDFDTELAMSDIKEDMKNMGTVIAGIGNVHNANISDVLTQTSRIGKVFHMKPREIEQLYNSFKSYYDQYRNSGTIQSMLMQVIKTSDADGVSRLFKISNYNIAGFISNYIQNIEGRYYTQRWYICKQDSGSRIIKEYTPKEGDPSHLYIQKNENSPSNWGNEWLQKVGYGYRGEGPESEESIKTWKDYPHVKESDYEVLQHVLSYLGWSGSQINEYERKHPGHKIRISNNILHVHRVHRRPNSGGHKRNDRYCFKSSSVRITDDWSTDSLVYEQTFDSQTMELSTFKKTMEIKLRHYQDLVSDDSNNTVTYVLKSDSPREYEMADEKRMEGCNSVSFTAQCSDGATLAEGAFRWKENGKQGTRLEDPKSKDFAMSYKSSTAENNCDDLLKKKSAKEKEIESLKSQITANDNKQKEINVKIRQAKMANNKPLIESLNKQYDDITSQTAALKRQLSQAQSELTAINNGIDEFYADLVEEYDGDYRIHNNMKDVQGMYQLEWKDEGNWVNGSDCFIFIRHGYCPTIKSLVTYSATLTLTRKPKYLLGIRIHRAVLSVDYKLTSSYSSESVVEVMKLDMAKSEKQRTDEVNARLKTLMEDMPTCSIKVQYQYANKQEDEEDDATIHLLWASDRLDIARDVESRLVTINAQLMFLDKVLQERSFLIDFMKQRIVNIVTREGRKALGESALSRWEEACHSAMIRQKSGSGDGNTKKQSLK